MNVAYEIHAIAATISQFKKKKKKKEDRKEKMKYKAVRYKASHGWSLKLAKPVACFDPFQFAVTLFR